MKRPALGRRGWVVLGVVAGIGAGLALASGPRGTPKAPGEQDGQVVPPLEKPVADRLARRMDADPTLKALLAICPADAWRRRSDLTRTTRTPSACAATPDTCLSDCLEFSSGNACFVLARVMEETEGLGPLYGAILFQLACASGDAAGCVNRAAGLRNAHYAGDPFPKHPEVARETCQFRSFAIGCDANDAWGCTMRGQAYRYGEGVPASEAAARRDFAAACAKDPKFAACKFARGQLAEMGKPAGAER